jgi:hypothetical protein
MKALSSSQQSEVKAWEEEILPCEHTLTLAQEPLISPGDGQSAEVAGMIQLTSSSNAVLVMRLDW